MVQNPISQSSSLGRISKIKCKLIVAELMEFKVKVFLLSIIYYVFFLLYMYGVSACGFSSS